MLTPVARNILTTRYLQKDTSGHPIESIDDLWTRVAEHAAKAEAPEDRAHYVAKFRDMLARQLFLFNSPTLVNAGTSINGLSACYVTKMDDSIDGIWQAKWNFAKIAQKGGGCGVNVCDLRPEGVNVAGSTHAKAGGPLKFLETIWRDMEAMTQAGFRSMACMAVMRIDHPDIFTFIRAKSPVRALARQLDCSENIAAQLWDEIKSADVLSLEQQRLVKLSESYLSNFNISVGVTDAFMHALEDGGDVPLHFDGVTYRTVKAGELWDAIAQNAWECGDPGLMFLDTTNDNSPYRFSGQRIKSTNPCGEQGLPAYGVCNLGSIDVAKFVFRGRFDWRGFKEVVALATRALNDICDVADWPTEDIASWVARNKPIGLGPMGYADALLMMGMRYGSDEALEFARDIAQNLYTEAERVSIQLGRERGVPDACKHLPTPRRNVTLISVAPTGTISLIAGCSSGCEPVFDLVQVRTDTTGSYIMPHPAIKAQLSIDDEVYPVGVDASILRGRAAEIASQVKDKPAYVTAGELDVTAHIHTQAAFQNGWHDGRAVDSGVSKTINLHNSASVEDIKGAYHMAYSLECKGSTVYRDGSKFFQVLNTSVAPKKKSAVVSDCEGGVCSI